MYKNIGGISYKADVYSFGMLLMEMVGRRKNLNPHVDRQSQIYFPKWIYDRFETGENGDELEDLTEEEKRIVRKMAIVAFWCIQTKPADRPSMSRVLEMLESCDEQHELPPKPFAVSLQLPTAENGESLNEVSSSSYSNTTRNESEYSSYANSNRNEVELSGYSNTNRNKGSSSS